MLFFRYTDADGDIQMFDIMRVIDLVAVTVRDENREHLEGMTGYTGEGAGDTVVALAIDRTADVYVHHVGRQADTDRLLELFGQMTPEGLEAQRDKAIEALRAQRDGYVEQRNQQRQLRLNDYFKDPNGGPQGPQA